MFHGSVRLPEWYAYHVDFMSEHSQDAAVAEFLCVSIS